MTAETRRAPAANRKVLAVVAWLWVGLPFAYGLIQLLAKIPALFSV